MTKIKLAITGAAGRMGMRLLALAKADSSFEILAALERADHPMLSHDAGEIAGIGPIGLPITSDLRPTPDVLIDFTAAASMRHWLKMCHDRGIAVVIGTTGLHEKDHEAIDIAAAHIPILQASNTSLGVNLLNKVVADVARRLGTDYDIEIVEGHHRFKKDAPSGTAISLADAIRAATDKSRVIGMHSLRVGDEVGKHTVYFAALGERLEFTHVATNRDTFVHGALKAARWLAAKPPGRYTMADVLGL